MSATFLIANGTDIRTVSGKLGHAQASTTMNIYAHLLKSAEQETANTMETFLQQTTDNAKQTKKSRPNRGLLLLFVDFLFPKLLHRSQ
jgi:site-specific recombinase XerC